MYTDKDLIELEQFFKSIPASDLPTEIEVVQAQRVTDIRKFIDSHLAAAKSNIGKSTFASFYDRLVKLKEKLQK